VVGPASGRALRRCSARGHYFAICTLGLGIAAGQLAAEVPWIGGGSGKTLILVEQNERKGLKFADLGHVLVAGKVARAGQSKDLLADPDMGRLSLGG
jgi:ABC-type branched-subunit amino acid transport system permease subunit